MLLLLLILTLSLSKTFTFDVSTGTGEMVFHTISAEHSFCVKMICDENIDVTIYSADESFNGKVLDNKQNIVQYDWCYDEIPNEKIYIFGRITNSNDLFPATCTLNYDESLAWYVDFGITIGSIIDFLIILGLIITIVVLSICLCRNKRSREIKGELLEDKPLEEDA